MADELQQARQQLIGKLADTMDPDNAMDMVHQFEWLVIDDVGLRDEFAKSAVAVMPGDVADPEGIAHDAYLIADAMIRRRRVKPAPPAGEDQS